MIAKQLPKAFSKSRSGNRKISKQDYPIYFKEKTRQPGYADPYIDCSLPFEGATNHRMPAVARPIKKPTEANYFPPRFQPIDLQTHHFK
jgi:hypothetical protein